jgi:hypothetical protein
MLFILIAIAWLAIVTIIVAACRMAARADAIATPRASEHARRSPRSEMPFPELTQFPGLTVSEPRDPIRQERLSVLAAGRTGRARGSAATAHRHPPRVGSLAGRGARGREARCV